MSGTKELYCCSSYYQLLIALMKALTEKQRIDLVLEEHGIETASDLAEHLKTNKLLGLVDRVFVCPDHERTDPYTQRLSSFLPWQRRDILTHMSRVFQGEETFIKNSIEREYSRVHVFWDLGYSGVYFNIRHIHYILHEDSLNSYQHIRENRPNYSYIFHPRGIKFLAKKWLHMGVIPFGYSGMCDVVEVNEKAGIEIPLHKVREVSRRKIEDALTEEEKRAVFDLFTAGVKRDCLSGGEVLLLLTEPFALTGRLPDEKRQIQLYKDIIKTWGKGRSILIKPHPRDDLDYGSHFPEAAVMEKNVPMEVLNFDAEFKIPLAVTVTSSAIGGIRCAEEKLFLGQEFLQTYKG